ncbi:MAG TPA: efflux RND transporter periplasmic adaptor subunit [Candidatus Dormibacteraeota bacterium]|nr:efflux RND transporter periplasmic adaptor subunit [Candidatus Dormibacteraeota bacterium]
MPSKTETEAVANGSQIQSAFSGKHPVRLRWLVAAIVFLAVGGILVSGILRRVRARAIVNAETAAMAVPSVNVVSPQRSAPSHELVLPGNVQPYMTAPIFSRTNGYLKRWYVDIGARVKKGQLLAEIDTPEVDQQLQQSRSNLATTEANLKLAEITKNRYQGLLKTNAVAQQDVDNAVGTYNANQATVGAMRANVRQLETLQSFEKIYAPFDGIVTVRNIDVGDLINSGSALGTRTDLFHIAQPAKLRVYVYVPQEYSQAATPGLTAELTLAEFPGQRFAGKLIRSANAINYATRTLQVEVDVDNPTGQLLSGSYAEVHLKLPGLASTYLLPVDTLLFRSEGLQVAVVKDGKVVLTQVTPGHDFGNQIEIVTGLNGDESVIQNPPDSVLTGQQVQIAKTAPGNNTGGGQ